MSITKINPNNFSTRLLKNKNVLKGLEKISEHGTSFTAGTSLLMSLTLRPLSILSTPDTEKENKQYAVANSIGSGLIKFALVEAVALPVEYAVKNIDNTPAKYLNKETIGNLSKNSTELAKSRSYKLITQIMKLGTGFLTAVPKSFLTIALIPIIMDKLFLKKTIKKHNHNQNLPQKEPVKDLNFTGNISEKISKNLGKIINKKSVQNFATKYESKDKDIAKHISAGTDILLTASFAYQTTNSKKIKQNRKKALIYNNIISTGITLTGGYWIDNLIKNKTGKFIKKFKQINAADPKLQKYVEGINILRPALIFAAIYYGILPMLSTYTAEKVDKFIKKH